MGGLRGWSSRCAVLVAVVTAFVGLHAPAAFASGPANDDIANATTLTTSPVTGTNVGATADDPPVYKVCDNQGCHYGGMDVWYRLPNPGKGWLTVSGDSANTSFNAQLALYEGSAGSVTSTNDVSADNKYQQFGTANTTDPIGFETSPGNDYFVVVDGYDHNNVVPSGTFKFNWQFTAAPANDNFANATTITTTSGAPNSLNITGSTTGATLESNEPEQFGTEYDGQTGWDNFGAHSVWYKWVAPATGQATIDTHGSSFDTVESVYTGSTLATLNQVTSGDDSAADDTTSTMTFNASANVTYRIQIDGKDDGLGGAFFGALTVNLHEVIPPANDTFANAVNLGTTASGTQGGTNAGASLQANEPDYDFFFGCNYNNSDNNQPAGKTVWYNWTAPTSGSYSFDTFSNPTFNTAIAAYTGSAVTNLTQVACNDDYSPSTIQSRMVINATGGQIYRIQVDGANDGTNPTSGTFTLTWHATPSNDNFANAATISGASGNDSSHSNVGASLEFGEPQNAGTLGGASVWFNWTAPGNGTYFFKTAGSNFNTTLGIYTGNLVSSLTSIASNNDVSGGDNTSYAQFAAVSGTTYHISVDGFQGAAGNITLTWALVPPPNDNFANAVTVAGASGQTTGTNVGATAESGEPAFLTGHKTSWWKWVATGNGPFEFDTEGSSIDTLLGVYTGSAVNSLAVVGQNDDVSGLDNKSKVNFTAVSGTTYYIAIDGKAGATGALTLNWAPPPPDLTPPVINSFTPAAGALVHGTTVPVTGDATDAGSGVQSMSFTIDDGSIIAGVVDESAPYGFTFDSTKLPDGDHTINVSATDTSNNVSSVQTHHFTVDNTAPSKPVFTKKPAVFTTATSAQMNFSAVDATSGLASYRVQVEKANWNAAAFSAWTTAPGATALATGTYKMTGLLAGYDYCFRVIAVDHAGNASAASGNTCVARLIDDKTAVHSTGWTQGKLATDYAGTFSTAKAAGKTLTLTGFHGTHLAIQAVVCSTCGAIKIYVGTTLIKTVSLVSATKKLSLIVLPAFSNRTGNIKIVTASAKPVTIDAIGASKS
jgi:hypothetical protein